ncbi:MAG: AlpA family phage regulatory protein [Bacteroidetes bacterium]|nr:AlpA family phage regulatory protein [Bacteroidota bacterium]
MESNENFVTTNLRIIRLKELEGIVGFKRKAIWTRVKKGTFPAPRTLGNNSIGWRSDQIDDWIDNLEEVTYSPRNRS